MNNLRCVSLREKGGFCSHQLPLAVTSWWPEGKKALGKMNREQSITVSSVYGLLACLTNKGGDPCSPGFHYRNWRGVQRR